MIRVVGSTASAVVSVISAVVAIVTASAIVWISVISAVAPVATAKHSASVAVTISVIGIWIAPDAVSVIVVVSAVTVIRAVVRIITYVAPSVTRHVCPAAVVVTVRRIISVRIVKTVRIVLVRTEHVRIVAITVSAGITHAESTHSWLTLVSRKVVVPVFFVFIGSVGSFILQGFAYGNL